MDTFACDVVLFPPVAERSLQSVARREPTVPQVHQRLRQDILRGRLRPGAVLSQVQLAAAYGISRTPLREAMRMLQEEGLLEAESNRRARVASFSLDDLEAISGQRILASALATSLTVGHMEPAALDQMQSLLEEMIGASAKGEAEIWRQANLAFHELHTSRAPELLRQDMRRLQERNAIYMAVWRREDPHLDPQSEVEHRSLVAACRIGDVAEATRWIARHNARIAITVMANAVPEREPVTIRMALQIALGVNGSHLRS